MLDELFSSRDIDAWNSQSNNVVKSPSVSLFKKLLCSVNSDRFLRITYCLFPAVYEVLSLFFIYVPSMYQAILYAFYCDVSGLLCALLLLLLNKIK